MVIGIVVSIIWALGLFFVVYFNFESALELKLNEWGDFLAGVFAPLAFFWLVLGYFQQGKELKLNTRALLQQERALMLQVAELKDSVQQQRALVEATREDVEINKEAIERQRYMEKANAQPIPEVMASGRGSSQGSNRYGFKIFNVGCAVSHVAVIAKDVNFNISGALRHSGSRWADDNYLGVSIDVPEKAKYVEGDHFFIKINYVDGMGAKESIEICFRWDDKSFLKYRE